MENSGDELVYDQPAPPPGNESSDGSKPEMISLPDTTELLPVVEQVNVPVQAAEVLPASVVQEVAHVARNEQHLPHTPIDTERLAEKFKNKPAITETLAALQQMQQPQYGEQRAEQVPQKRKSFIAAIADFFKRLLARFSHEEVPA